MSSEGQKNLSCASTHAQVSKKEREKKQRGQLLIEYILLMLLAVALATQIQSRLVGGDADDPNNAGILSQFVFRTANVIARDTPGD